MHALPTESAKHPDLAFLFIYFFKADFAKYLPCPFGIRSLPADLYGVHIIWVTPFLARA